MGPTMRHILSTLLLMALSFSAWAVNYDPDTHAVYAGQYNGDGYQDIVLKGVPLMHIVYMGEYAIPFEYEEDAIVFLGQADGSYQIVYPADRSIVDGIDLTPSNHLVHYLDINNDQQMDIAFQGKTANDTSFLAYGGEGNSEIRLVTEQELGVEPHAGSVTWVVSDADQDGVQDISFRQNNTVLAIAYGGAVVSFDAIIENEPTQPVQQGHEVGFLAGQFEVSTQGVPNYQLPLEVIPSTVGFAPSLSITYSGSYHQSHLGQGWALSGISSIQRCPETITQDGQNNPVDHWSNDALCLDGIKLRSIGNNQYVKEINNDGMRIEVLGSGSSRSFKTIHADGRITEYGMTANSRIEPTEGSDYSMVWKIDRISDRFGNQIQYQYTETGQTHRIDKITYGPNEIYFDYLSESSKQSYIAPKTKIVKVGYLKHVIMRHSGTDVFHYELSYQNPNTHLKLLTSIQKCMATGACLPATHFDWENTQTLTAGSDFVQENEQLGALNALGYRADDARILTGYFNDDPYQDILRLQDHNDQAEHFIAFGRPEGGFDIQHNPSGLDYAYYNHNTYHEVADYDGDGLSDILQLQTNGNHAISYARPDGTFETYHDVGNLENMIYRQDITRIFTADFDGDGRADILKMHIDGFHWVYYSQGRNQFERQFQPGELGGGPFQMDSTYIFTGHFNHDHLADILVYRAHGEHTLYLSEGFADFKRINNPSGIDGRGYYNNHTVPIVSDFNMDGYTDLLILQTDGNQFLAVSNGVDGFTATETVIGLDGRSFSKDQFRAYSLDVNKDGISDVLGLNTSGDNYLALGTGNLTFDVQEYVTGFDSTNEFTFDSSHGKSVHLLGDFDGDTNLNLINFQHDQNHFAVELLRQQPRLQSITNGAGNSIKIDYASNEDLDV